MTAEPGWIAICPRADVSVDRGVAALVDGRQIALFRVMSADGTGEEILVIANRDPFSDANVLARGIIGSAGAQTYVASPMFKQRFDLHTGRCLDADDVSVEVWPARVVDDWIEILVS